MSDHSALLGTWEMISWKREVIATGELIDALGENPRGYISYAADGRFFALVVSRNRAKPAMLPPNNDEKIALFDSMLAYAGSYSVDDEKAIHHVDISWNEAWTGTDQVRFYVLEGDTLMINGAPAIDPHTGEKVVHRITFRRVSPR
ncbi:MAG: lipocalin-like domain-containing protein [Hyphomicrobiales bacterium]|nr:lipocalin-like domain-containing protein [Hyphomicrobiales bacterium]